MYINNVYCDEYHENFMGADLWAKYPQASVAEILGSVADELTITDNDNEILKSYDNYSLYAVTYDVASECSIAQYLTHDKIATISALETQLAELSQATTADDSENEELLQSAVAEVV